MGAKTLKPAPASLYDEDFAVWTSETARLLRAASGEVKTAIVMARRGLDAPAARARLSAAGGRLRRVLESKEA